MNKNYKYITNTFGKRVRLYKIGPKSWARMYTPPPKGKSPKPRTYEKKGIIYKRLSASDFWKAGYSVGTIRNIMQPSGRVVKKKLCLRGKVEHKLKPYWAPLNKKGC